MYKKLFLSSLLVVGLQQLNAQPLELTPVIGKNFFDSDTALKNANFFGIRASQYITCDTALQFGYDRMTGVDFKQKSRYYTNRGINRTIGGESSSNGSSYLYGQNGPYSQSQDTDIDRFFINVLHDVYVPNPNIQPFVFAGLGYERVDQETEALKSQGFFDAGAGLKIPVADNVSLYSEAKAIKKFDDSTLDFTVALGLGFTFGQAIAQEPVVFQPTQEINELQPQSTSIIVDAPTPQMDTVVVQEPKATIIEEEQPLVIQEEAPMASGEYYVQLAAMFHSDLENNHLIQTLQETGEPFSIKSAKIHGRHAQLLLAGPYMTYQDAQAVLPQMRSIARGAFIKHLDN